MELSLVCWSHSVEAILDEPQPTNPQTWQLSPIQMNRATYFKYLSSEHILLHSIMVCYAALLQQQLTSFITQFYIHLGIRKNKKILVKQHSLFLSQKKFSDKESKASKLAPEYQGPRILYSIAPLCRTAIPKVTRQLDKAARAPVITCPGWTVAWRKAEKRDCTSNDFMGSYGSKLTLLLDIIVRFQSCDLHFKGSGKYSFQWWWWGHIAAKINSRFFYWG